ncbi:MAG: hypothetical protein JWM95_4501 [Gemmatimonadetes bacterium]|nr:hypothetical protein [Gemmatimonadota bacterium]
MNAKTLADHIRRTVAGPMWHGPALTELLTNVSAGDANTRPIPHAHTIWELVLHAASWAEIVRSRMTAAQTPDPTDAQNFPPVTDPSAEHWKRDLARLLRAYADLAADVALLSDEELAREVPGRGYSFREMFHGVVEHGTYHGGQIALLKRSLEEQR